MQPTDDILITESLAGSNAAFEELMRRYERLVFRVAWTYARQRESALDICQDVFIKVHRGLKSYRGSNVFRAWLMRITHNECSNWLRREKRHRDWDELDDEAPAGRQLASPATQEAELLETEQREELLRNLASLHPRQRLALTLRYFEKLPFREIAQALDCSEGLARNIAFRGLKKLRSDLNPHRGLS